MKILFVWDADYPWDIRVEKICNTLIEHGHEVHLVCRNQSRKNKEEIYNGLYIHRISCLPKRLGGLNDIFTFPIFFSPVWLSRINTIRKKYKIDLIIVRDLPMALAAVLIGKIYSVPVILDMAECYPELVRLIWKYEPFKIQNIFIRNPYFVDIVENIVLKNVNHVFVMVEESKQRLINKQVNKERITIVSNTPIIKKFIAAKATYPGKLNYKRDKLILLYVGFVNYSRGLDTIIESIKEYIKFDNNIYLIILGTGSAEDNLKTTVKNNYLNEYVGFEGWVDNKAVPEYIASSDICLVPHHKCSHWDNTIPNKLFDYMAAGKPVLVSNVNPVERIVEHADCGSVYRDYDINDLVSQILKLKESEMRYNLGKNGVEAIKKHYNWDNDSARMLQSIEKYSKHEK